MTRLGVLAAGLPESQYATGAVLGLNFVALHRLRSSSGDSCAAIAPLPTGEFETESWTCLFCSFCSRSVRG